MHSLYTFTVPVFIKTLNALESLLRKVETDAKEQGISESELLAAALAPDMFPLVKQVQLVSDHSKGAVARLTGLDAPKYEDNEATFAELYARIEKTLEFLAGIPEDAFAGAEERQITLPYFPGKYMSGFDYTREFILPNIFFHATTAYDILRMKGFSIGKGDFIGGLPLQEL